MKSLHVRGTNDSQLSKRLFIVDVDSTGDRGITTGCYLDSVNCYLNMRGYELNTEKWKKIEEWGIWNSN